MSTRTLAVISAGLSTPSSTRLLADRLTAATVAALRERGDDATVEAFAPPAATTSEAWVGASGTWAGLSAANSLRSTGTTSSPSRSSCSSTVFSGSPAWSIRNSCRW